MARKLEEVADILYTLLKDSIELDSKPFHLFSLPTLYMIADRPELGQKQINIINGRLRNYKSVLLLDSEDAVVTTQKYYRKRFEC